MTTIISGNSITKLATTAMLNNNAVSPAIFTFSELLEEGIAKVVVSWSEPVTVVMNKNFATFPAGSIALNYTDVPAPTTFYLYADGTTGTPVFSISGLNPAVNPAVTAYILGAIVRFMSVGGVLTTYWVKTPNQNGSEEVVHNLIEDTVFESSMWLSGLSTTLSAGGKISTTEGYIRFPGNKPQIIPACTEGPIVLENESAIIAGINNLTTYAGGETITAGKYFKVAVGALVDVGEFADTDYVLARQGKPAVEYASAAEAYLDASNVAPVEFSSAYSTAVQPLFYIVALKGDYTNDGANPAGLIYDIRATGFIKSAGGVAATSHHALSDLTGFDDHSQYLKTDGTRQLSGNWNMGTVDATTTGHVSANHVISTATTGTAPVQVTSTTACTNLNADLLDGNHASAFQPAGSYITAGGTVPLTANWDAGAYKITAATLESDVATGTAPFTVASTTVVTNLNASALQGNAASDFAVAAKGVTNGDSHDHVGGDGAQIDHGGLGGLADDDHTQYLLAAGTRALTGNMLVDSGITIDGVDISAHAADASAHHAPVTLSTAADVLLGLSTQQITIDSQNAGTVLAGPSVGSGPVAPTFRKLKQTDLDSTEGTLTLVNGQNDNVVLTDGVDCYLVAGPTGNFGMSGFTGGYPGRVITIANWNINFNMTSYHQNIGSTAANRIINPGNNADEATTRYGLFRYQYFGTTQRWVLVSVVA